MDNNIAWHRGAMVVAAAKGLINNNMLTLLKKPAYTQYHVILTAEEIGY